jgi:hypothetical protein
MEQSRLAAAERRKSSLHASVVKEMPETLHEQNKTTLGSKPTAVVLTAAQRARMEKNRATAVERRKSLSLVPVPANVDEIITHKSATAPGPNPSILSVTDTSVTKSGSFFVSVCVDQKAMAVANCRTAMTTKLLKSVSVSSSLDPVAGIQGKRFSSLVETEQSKMKSQERALKKHKTVASALEFLDQTIIEQTTTTNQNPTKNGRMDSNERETNCRTLTQTWDKKGAPDRH